MPTESTTTSTRRAELLGLTAFAVALMLLISLSTFNPTDPAPFFKAGTTGPARNFIGPVGAFLAELLVPQLFGVAAMLLPLVLGLTGRKLFWCRPIDAPYTKAAGLVLLLASLTAFLSLTFGNVTIEGEAVRAGGAVGELMAGLLTTEFNRTGAYIVVATSLFVAMILATQFSFAAFLKVAGTRIAERVRSVRTAWVHWRETRRKERMRREVIRKHTQREPGMASVPRVRRVRAGDAPAADAADDEDADEEPVLDLELRPPATAPPAQKALPFAIDDG